MTEHDDKIDIQSELGVSRRDLLRRGAVVGGALLWVAPAIQSLSPPAYAETVSPKEQACCLCTKRNSTGQICTTDFLTQAQCADFCGGASRVKTYLLDATCSETNHHYSCVAGGGY